MKAMLSAFSNEMTSHQKATPHSGRIVADSETVAGIARASRYNFSER
jgi:hypothetical protein